MANCLRVFFGVVLLSVLGAGCTTTSITNLTPADFPRSNSGLYRVEAAWQSNQKSIREGTVDPVVIVGDTQFPMQPVPFAEGRYETLVPVGPDEDSVFYQFKFNFTYDAVPQPRANSKRSEQFRLDITPSE